MRRTPMTCTLMRYTPMICTLMRSISIKFTPMQAYEMHAHKTYGSWGDFSFYAKLRFVGFCLTEERNRQIKMIGIKDREDSVLESNYQGNYVHT
jgi:hypothetical protein